jgi:SAM-dependent methyltransferase
MPTRSDPPALLNRLATLSDMARLRMMRLLAREELSVGELARALQLPQSTVSRHLKLLHETGWLAKRAEGTATFYRLREDVLEAPARELWALASAQLGRSPTLDEDDTRLREVLAARRIDARAFFGRIGGEWDELRRTLFGYDFTAAALLNLLDENWIVADLGCGTGNATELLAPLVSKVIAVDREPAMLEAARRRLAGIGRVEFRRGEMNQLPLRDGEVNAAVVMLVMPYIPEPAEAVAEIARVLAAGGTALLVDMVAHDREEYRQTMGHVHLGFTEQDVQRWAKAAGLSRPRYRRLRPDPEGKGPSLFAASMRRF